ncbi:uncharacterized protein [Misgurnus anguillicaudatus]|uniref:uncharacterized protein isoform X1 n=1 Tax=Misgurnus anguillicaudatus TaxID=75329 RepID=UPI003CCF4FB0
MIFIESKMKKLIYLILLSVLVSIPGSFEVNLARKGTATQSSSVTAAQYAIDGLRSTASYCSITGRELSPWWRLDLLDYYGISTVVITTSESRAFLTNGAEIHIGNSTENNGNNNPICAVTSGFEIGQTISYSCGVMVGRYINVVMTGLTDYLTLCEVEVYETENVALSSAAIQSSTYYPFVPQNAIDGIRYGKGDASYCAVTAHQSDPWLSLDLQYEYEIGTVIITARSDCCAAQTNGAEIRIGNSTENYGNNNPKCAVTSGFQVGETISYSCNGMEGRYVNVVMTGLRSNLSLCEVEVYGKRHYIKSTLRLKLVSSVNATAMSDEILNQLESALSLHNSDFTLSWKQIPYKEEVKKHNITQNIPGKYIKGLGSEIP